MSAITIACHSISCWCVTAWSFWYTVTVILVLCWITIVFRTSRCRILGRHGRLSWGLIWWSQTWRWLSVAILRPYGSAWFWWAKRTDRDIAWCILRRSWSRVSSRFTIAHPWNSSAARWVTLHIAFLFQK